MSPSPWLRELLTAGALLTLYLVLLTTGSLQEDAYITFRTGFNYADHGEYTFNVGERYPGATSILYGHWVALLRLLTGDLAIPAVVSCNALAMIVACWLMARRLADELHMPRQRWLLWCLLAAAPQSLVIGTNGMETSILVLGLACAASTMGRVSPRVAHQAVLAGLPFVRPDAAAFSLIFAAFAPGRSKKLIAALWIAAGVAVTGLATWYYTDKWLPNAVSAKSLFSAPDRSLGATWERAVSMYLTNSYLAPFHTKYLHRIGGFYGSAIVTVGLMLGLAVVAHRRGWDLRLLGALGAAALLVPAAYAYGGILHPWYMQPSAWLAACLGLGAVLLAVARQPARRRRLASHGLAAAVALGAAGHYMLSLNLGAQESRYRAGVGDFIAKLARPGDTLFLEPAGYIPFHAGIRTIDHVGLASPVVLDFLKADRRRWWIDLVTRLHPTFIVDRSDIAEGKTESGVELNERDQAWLRANYVLVARFRYVPHAYARSGVEAKILALGSHADYYVFRLRR